MVGFLCLYNAMPGDMFSLDLTSLWERLEEDAFEGRCYVGRELFMFQEGNPVSREDPFIDLWLGNEMVACDGENVYVVNNNNINIVIELQSEESDTSFELEWGNARVALNECEDF